MLKGILGAGTVCWLVDKEGFDEALSVIRDGGPNAVLEGEDTLTNLLHNILVALTVERRHAGEEDVGDDAGGPNIALLVVALVEDLGSNVVRGAKFLVQVSVGVVDEGGSEVDDLDLVVLLVLFEKDVLGLQVTMHDVGLVAVVDAGEDLLDEDGGVALSKLATLEDLVEKLTSLADPAKDNQKLTTNTLQSNELVCTKSKTVNDLLGNEIVALLVFEELVHLDDVRVILKRKLVTKTIRETLKKLAHFETDSIVH